MEKKNYQERTAKDTKKRRKYGQGIKEKIIQV